MSEPENQESESSGSGDSNDSGSSSGGGGDGNGYKVINVMTVSINPHNVFFSIVARLPLIWCRVIIQSLMHLYNV
jgi:hypothetical protein